ncbi:MAG TPA: DoxX family protein [Chloroflexota bacterium]|nr:DoxX family protein [Chloroflexota bacterium]
MLLALSSALAAISLLAAVPKLLGHPRMRASAAHFGIEWARYRLIGVAELAAAVGVLGGLYWRPVGVAAGVCLAPLLLGAVYQHIRVHEEPRRFLPALVTLAIDAAYLGVALAA